MLFLLVAMHDTHYFIINSRVGSYIIFDFFSKRSLFPNGGVEGPENLEIVKYTVKLKALNHPANSGGLQ